MTDAAEEVLTCSRAKVVGIGLVNSFAHKLPSPVRRRLLHPVAFDNLSIERADLLGHFDAGKRLVVTVDPKLANLLRQAT